MPTPNGYKHSEAVKAKIGAASRMRIAADRERHQRIRALGTKASSESRRLPKDVRALRHRMSVYKASAKARGLDWELTEKEFADIVKRNCWYCNTPPSMYQKRWPEHKFNGVDRLDSARGYSTGNVVPCCRECDDAKGTMSAVAFVEMAQRIAKNHDCHDPRS